MFDLTAAAAMRLARLLERDNVSDEITVRFVSDRTLNVQEEGGGQ